LDGDGDLDLLTANAFSTTVSVRLNNGTGPPLATKTPITPAVFTLWPNPASTQVRFSGARPLAAIGLADLTGRRIATATADATGAATLPVAGLPAGVYIVRAGTQVRRLVVE
jgi:hypothetical protein